jgi:hypothetical protein
MSGSDASLWSGVRWALRSWLVPADRPSGWEQAAGRRLRLRERSIGPQNPPTSEPEKNPAQQPAHATPQSH